ncbi:MAG: hypothetical protein AAGF49_14205, partial [Pseudomonadota bacterium]
GAGNDSLGIDDLTDPDNVTDFNAAEDVICLDASVFALGDTLDEGEFFIDEEPPEGQTALVYDTFDGGLTYYVDGEIFTLAILEGSPAISVENIELF